MTVASPHLGDEVFRKRADGVKAGVVCGGKEILERRQHPLAELRLPDGRKPPVGAKALNEALVKLYTDEIIPCIRNGLCASIYTQVSDVEDEINGFLTYDRAVCKGDAPSMAAIAQELQREIEG